MRIGFIGAGNMGAAMIRRLVEAGYPVAVYARSDRSRAKVKDLEVSFATSPAKLAANCDLVFTNVTATADVEEVVLGPQGVINGGQPGMTLIDMSTISPPASRKIAAALDAKGIAMLDAPVSGGVGGATTGTLTICVGGKRDVFERMRPLLENLGKTIFYMGSNGAGLVTKLANQIAQLANIQGAAEALLFAGRNGVDMGTVREAILSGFGASKMLDVLGKKMVERDFKAGIVAALHHKDLNMALELAQQSGISLPATAQIVQQLNVLMENGWGEQDSSSLLRVLEQKAGTKGEKFDR